MPPTQLLKQDFLDLFDRVVDSDWLAPMKNGTGPGYEVAHAIARVMERLSLGGVRVHAGALPYSASAGFRATGEVEFYRLSGVAGSVTVKAGARVGTSTTGLEYLLLTDVVFTGAALGPITGDIQAIAPGYEWNVPGEVELEDGTVIPGEIDEVTYPLQDPEFADPSIMVRQVDDITNGKPPTLDEIGRMRGMERGADESDNAYLARVTQLPDTVSPDAVARAMRNLLDPLGYAATITETWQPEYQTCWDAPGPTAAIGRIVAVPGVRIADGETFVLYGLTFEFDKNAAITPGNFAVNISDLYTAAEVAEAIQLAVALASGFSLLSVDVVTVIASDVISLSATVLGVGGNIDMTDTVTDVGFLIEGMAGGSVLGTMQAGYDPDLFCYDDPRTPVDGAITNRWLDEMDHAGAFFVTIPSLPAMRDVGMAYDDTATTIADHLTTIGQRAHNAYDVDTTVPAGVLQGGYDGFDLPRQAVYLGAHATLQALKPIAVLAQVELAGQ